MPLQLMCRKVGNTQIFLENGQCIPVTVLEAGSNAVVQKKSAAKEGYDAIQLGYQDVRPSRMSKAEVGHCAKAKLAPKRHLVESRLSAEEAAGFEVGQEVKVDVFRAGQLVDVEGTSKGRGTSGVVRRHHFKIKRATHGTHENRRHTGSIGPGSNPGRVIKGLKMAGRMGNERVSVQNLEVVRVDGERGLLYIKGSVPGYRGGVVRVRSAVKSA